MRGPFKLYPEERHWWSFNDHGAVLDVMQRLQPKRVLEFGPGSSTLALIEGGAAHIDTCEDDPIWAATYEERLVPKYPGLVFLHRYTWRDPLSIPSIDDQRYDLALIDGPRDDHSDGPDGSMRIAVVRYALERCKAVLVPTEGRDQGPMLRVFDEIANGRGRQYEVMETGPLATSFALLIWPDQFQSDEAAEPVTETTVEKDSAGYPQKVTRSRRTRKGKR